MVEIENKANKEKASIPSVIFAKESATVVEKLRDAAWVIAAEMKKQELTSIELVLRNGFKVKLINPKEHAILMKGGKIYAKK